MRKVTEIPAAKIKAVFTDLDHTVTERNGLLRSASVHAMEQLKLSGRQVIIVTGGSAGWADALVRLLPIDAIIFENGAGMFFREGPRISSYFIADRTNQEQNRQRLAQAFEHIRRVVPNARLARDQEFRMFDYAVDYNQDEPRLSPAEVQQAIEILNSCDGVQWKMSSIHINFWIGIYNKRAACEAWLKKHAFSVDNCLYCGDAPNDEPLFEFFPNSVGVENIRPFLDKMFFRPQFIANQPFGAGFCEVVNHLLTQ